MIENKKYRPGKEKKWSFYEVNTPLYLDSSTAMTNSAKETVKTIFFFARMILEGPKNDSYALVNAKYSIIFCLNYLIDLSPQILCFRCVHFSEVRNEVWRIAFRNGFNVLQNPLEKFSGTNQNFCSVSAKTAFELIRLKTVAEFFMLSFAN